jgi:acyl-CoA synthetase (AMP-forming)/AMP-acid ligase II
MSSLHRIFERIGSAGGAGPTSHGARRPRPATPSAPPATRTASRSSTSSGRSRSPTSSSARTESPTDIKDHVKKNLAGYKVPRQVEFLDELPRNATGKVLKRELAER